MNESDTLINNLGLILAKRKVLSVFCFYFFIVKTISQITPLRMTCTEVLIYRMSMDRS